MKKNLELKVKLENFRDILKDITSFGAKEADILYQVDTYFLIGKKRLKLRDMNGEFQLIYYSRPDIQESKLSRYYVFRFTNYHGKIVEKILNVFFTTRAIVSKKRILYLYKHTRIHLDEVQNLGKFLELETGFDKKEPRYDFYHEHNIVVNALGLSRYEKIRSSYSDLVFEIECYHHPPHGYGGSCGIILEK